MYYGRAAETVEWFAKLGYTLPYRVNTADFILDLSSADVSTEKRCGHCCSKRAEVLSRTTKIVLLHGTAAGDSASSGSDVLHLLLRQAQSRLAWGKVSGHMQSPHRSRTIENCPRSCFEPVTALSMEISRCCSALIS